MKNLKKFEISKENQKNVKGGNRKDSKRDVPCKGGEIENDEGFCVPIDYEAFDPMG